MTDFNKYKTKREQEKLNTKKSREEILAELHSIDTGLLEAEIPDENNSNISYSFVEEKKFREMEKLAAVSQKLGQEARMIKEKWGKDLIELLG